MGNDCPPLLSPNFNFNLQIKMPKHKSRSEMGLLNTLQVDGELLSQLEKGGNINLLIDSTIFTPKSSVAVAGDAGTTTAPVPVNADASAAVPERSMDPTAVAAAAANSSNLPAISPAEIEGLNLNVKKEEHRVRDEGTYRYSCSSLYNVQFWRTHVI